jgi:hypothetical protein
MTAQELFDKVYLGLHAQNFKQCLDDSLHCALSNSEGLRCAVGHALYEYELSALESQNYDTTAVFYRLESRYRRDELAPHLGLLSSLQKIHDNADSPSDMISSLRAYANSHNLRVPT